MTAVVRRYPIPIAWYVFVAALIATLNLAGHG